MRGPKDFLPDSDANFHPNPNFPYWIRKARLAYTKRDESLILNVIQ